MGVPYPKVPVTKKGEVVRPPLFYLSLYIKT